MLTKSGGNKYHGSLFEFVRNDFFDLSLYAFPRPSAGDFPSGTTTGFELDGPVRIPHLFNGRDRLFFMSNYEAFRLRQTRKHPVLRAQSCDVWR